MLTFARIALYYGHNATNMASRLRPARGSDQDGGSALVPQIVAQARSPSRLEWVFWP